MDTPSFKVIDYSFNNEGVDLKKQLCGHYCMALTIMKCCDEMRKAKYEMKEKDGVESEKSSEPSRVAVKSAVEEASKEKTKAESKESKLLGLAEDFIKLHPDGPGSRTNELAVQKLAKDMAEDEELKGDVEAEVVKSKTASNADVAVEDGGDAEKVEVEGEVEVEVEGDAEVEDVEGEGHGRGGKGKGKGKGNGNGNGKGNGKGGRGKGWSKTL